MPMITFDRHQLLPEMAERTDEPQVFFLMLLHQREKAYGYAMFHYQPGEVPSNFFQHWNIVVSGALSNIHKRDELLLLYEERRLSSITDVMTRLLNRRGLEEQLTPIWQQLCVRHETAAFVSFDVDRLKQINDTYGHQAGDYAIRLTASAIRKAAPKEAILARVGGDEFAAILKNEDYENRDALSSAFKKTLTGLNAAAGNDWERISVAMGLASYDPGRDQTVNDVVHRADKLMYADKRSRKNIHAKETMI